MEADGVIIKPDDPILITGAAGFIGSRVVESLVECGFRNLRCFARPSGDTRKLDGIQSRCGDKVRIEIIRGNLLSRSDCLAATKDAGVIYHLAAGRGEKSYPDAFMNSVVTTRNLLDAALEHRCLKRIVSISSFSVYSNQDKPRGQLLDESCPMEAHPERRGDAYSYAKVKQDELVMDYGKSHHLPYVILRPGVVFGPGNEGITGRVGLGTFGIFLHLGGGNPIPFSYVDNCAEAIVLAGLQPGVEGEIFNVMDDQLPSSRQFLRRYKKNVRSFRSLPVPKFASYLLCYLWEKYSEWSEGQLPPAFNRKTWHAYWKKSRYTNAKLKARLGWRPRVPIGEAFDRYFESCRLKRR